MSIGKYPLFRWGAFEDFEGYGSSSSLLGPWVESDSGSVATVSLDVSQAYEGQQSVKVAINNASGSSQSMYIERAFSGLLPLATYAVEVRLRRTNTNGTPVLWSNAEINMTTPANNTWGLSGVLTAGSTTAQGVLPVRLEIRGIVNGATVDYHFDEVRIYKTLELATPLDNVAAYPEPRKGSDFAETVGGVEDSWVLGERQMLEGDLRWLSPSANTIGSITQAGWDGVDGWRAWLQFARAKNIWQFVPDRNTPSTFYNCYLVEPMTGGVSPEPNGTKRLRIAIRTKDDTPFVGF